MMASDAEERPPTDVDARRTAGEARPPGELPDDVAAAIDALRPVDVAIGVLTYNNADTVKAVAETAVAGLTRHLPGVSAAFVNADAGSADGTPEVLAGAGLPVIRIHHEAALAERLTVPFHGVPGRGPALRGTLAAAHGLGARVLVLLEADVVSVTEEWIAELARPVIEAKADFVTPAYPRHRYDGTITSLVLGPLVRALYGRRVRQPLGGQQALSPRLIDHLLIHPRWDWHGREITDLWVLGTAIADGFTVCEAWLGRRTVRSRTRTSDLPTMVAQTVGSTFALMHHHDDLWLEVRGSEPLPEIGRPAPPSVEPVEVDVTRMLDGFRLGLSELLPIWEHILAPETLGDVLGLETPAELPFRFPNDLWARVVYDFALGYHYDVVYREHLLKSLVPLYLGRTAAFVMATRDRGAAAGEALLDDVGTAFEGQKAYLADRWR
jgi:glucosylglycerate synthase